MGPGPEPLSRIPVAREKGRVAFVRSSRVLMALRAGAEVNFSYSAARLSQLALLAGGWRGVG